MASTELKRPAKDFISIRDLSPEELVRLLDLAARLKTERKLRLKAPTASALAGRHVAMLFEKPSLRTRSTFEIATRELGAETLDVPAKFAEGVREPLQDVARNLERWIDAIVVRTYAQSKVTTIASAAPNLHVINALTDDEHPCQALADLLTIRERLGRLEGVVLAFVGDGNNVYHSLALAGALAGMEVRLAHPAGYGPDEAILERARAIAATTGGRIVVERDPRAVAQGAHVLYTDAWTSMGQEAETERRRVAFGAYRIDDALLAVAPAEAFVMHCLPAHRGEEISDAVMDGPQSAVFDQAENRLHAQNALLRAILA